MLIARRLLLPTLSLFLFSVTAQGQGSGTTFPGGMPGGVGSGAPGGPYTVTYSFKGQLQQIDRGAGAFLMVDDKSEQKIVFHVGEKTRYRADKKALGKKKISWSELAVGQRIRVKAKVVREEPISEDEKPAIKVTVLEVKVLKPKKV